MKQERNKIVFLTQSLGGVETYIREIVLNVDKSKFELIIVSPFGESINDLCENQNIKHYTLKMARGFNPLLDIKTIWQFCQIIKRERPALLHVHSSKGGFLGRIAGRLCRVRSVFTPHGLSYLSFTGFSRNVFFLLEVFAKRFTDRILAVSHSEANRLQYEVGHKAEVIDVTLNAIDVTGSTPMYSNIDKGSDRIMHVGTIARLTYQKNPLLFIEVAKLLIDRVPNLMFHILGAGLHDHLKPQVDALIDKYGIQDKINIIDWGHFSGSRTFLESLDVFVLTSVFEGLPFSLLEAMAIGKPCVVSKCDGCNDVIQNGVNGFACMTKEEFSNSIFLLLTNRELASNIGMEAFNYVRTHHNIKIAINSIENIYLSNLKRENG
ncbi:glycosyltransferase family 4 protein [Arcticibacter tournemirensis]|uniref:Glycosyltransferase family 1 protein n=1 Tax=Arcticibacter tournemirensis TaxID=699437 RepID=A0A4Q0M8I5_9SPHI|nr:glycosyltransferase family 4 protein [Arcticibacter tournemirensis]RXF69355.1 glycosyltransferase family 1 protein [Arcticibacter tournemirensis]